MHSTKLQLRIKKLAIDTMKDIHRLDIKDKEYLVSVSGVKGLSVRVYPNGKKEYYLRYNHPYIKGKRSRIMIGKTYELTLHDAKEKAKSILDMVASNIDPKVNKQQRSNNKYAHLRNATFFEVAQAWKEHKMNRQSQRKTGKTAYSESILKFWDLCLGYMCAEIGGFRMNDITSEAILNICESIQNNENNATFVGASARLYTEKVFSFAVARGLCDRNVAIDTRGELAPAGSGNHLPAITKPEPFAVLLKDIDTFTSVSTITLEAMKMLPYVFVRSVDLRSMRWKDIDWNNKLWEFSPTKGEGRDDMVSDLVVPLADQVLSQLKRIKALTGHKEYVFASIRASKNPYISKATLVQAFHRLGYKGVQCAHGFRASAKTMLMEQPELRYSDIVTELQLGHRIKDTHGGAYNRLDEIDTRIQMMQNWANYIDDLKDSKY